jgi:hypothetical protein
MMAVEVSTQPTFSLGTPRPLFEGRYFGKQFPQMGSTYDVSPDGERFLMVKAAERTHAAAQINVVLNWFEELKQRVPAGKQ